MDDARSVLVRPYRYMWRALIVLLCAALGAGSFASAVVNVTRDSNPDAALRFAASDPSALAAKADLLLSKPGAAAKDIVANANSARTSLVKQAINPRALRQLGFVAEAKGDTVQARALIALSTAASRRDFGSQLWLIENSVRSGDMAKALSHYDIALRISLESASLLYPILSAALPDEAVQAALVPYIKANPSWLGSFLIHAQGVGAQPVALAQMILKARGLPAEERFRAVQTGLITQLVNGADFEMALRFYLSLPGASKVNPTSTRFENVTTDPQFAPLTWQIQNSAGIQGGFEPIKQASALQLHILANSGERGAAVRKLLYLTAGVYSFAENRTAVRFGNGAAAYWQLSCNRGGQFTSIWRSDTDTPKISIAADCQTQMLDLVVAGGSYQDGAELIIKSVSLNRS
jgi:hypothetical protein